MVPNVLAIVLAVTDKLSKGTQQYLDHIKLKCAIRCLLENIKQFHLKVGALSLTFILHEVMDYNK